MLPMPSRPRCLRESADPRGWLRHAPLPADRHQSEAPAPDRRPAARRLDPGARARGHGRNPPGHEPQVRGEIPGVGRDPRRDRARRRHDERGRPARRDRRHPLRGGGGRAGRRRSARHRRGQPLRLQPGRLRGVHEEQGRRKRGCALRRRGPRARAEVRHRRDRRRGQDRLLRREAGRAEVDARGHGDVPVPPQPPASRRALPRRRQLPRSARSVHRVGPQPRAGLRLPLRGGVARHR